MQRFALAMFVMAPLLVTASDFARAEGLTEVQTLALSTTLYFEGVARGDAVLVLAAAKLRKPVEFRPTDQGSDVAGSSQPLGWQEMRDEAASLADGDAALAGWIADLDAEAGKGMASGPFYNIASLAPGEIETYPSAEFRGGELAEAYVEAGADSDLNLSVHDAAGNLVCADRDPSPIAYCSWRPAETGGYVVTVENLGPGAATFAFMTN